MSDQILEYLHGNPTLIVSFGGYAMCVGMPIPFEFLKLLNTHFPNTDKLFLKDTYFSSYHRGIGGISTDVESTAQYLRTKINEKVYSNVLFLGNSGGGYAAVLFGSLLNVTTVIAFVPQTILRKSDKCKLYKDLKPFINDTTMYHLYADLSVKKGTDPHHISQCQRIGKFPNVMINFMEKIDVKELRNTGELKSIIEKVI
jgi:hypothetical protein